MLDHTNIEWSGGTWNFVAAYAPHPKTGERKRGWFCTKVNKDCANCYAEALNIYRGNGLKYLDSNLEKVEFELVEHLLLQPLKIREPQKVFVNSMTDYFHPAIPDEFKRLGFAVMAACPHLTFQILTKQPAAMAKFFQENSFAKCYRDGLDLHKSLALTAALAMLPLREGKTPAEWPLPNVHLGVTAGHQEALEEFWPYLRDIPAAVRFISAEPLLEELNLEYAGFDGSESFGYMPGLHWLILGGESGPKSRECDLANIEAAVEWAKKYGVKVFVKQAGDKPTYNGVPVHCTAPKGKDMAEWPEPIRIREFPT